MKPLCVAFVLAFSARMYAATFAVTNTNDSGPGSLRWAIEQANTTPGDDTVMGTAPGGTIALASPLPAITDRASLSLYYYRIDGTNAGDGDGFVVNAANVSVSFLRVANFKGDGLVLLGGYAQVSDVISTGNRNGIRIDGSHAKIIGIASLSNRENGIWVRSTSSGNTIGQDEGICVVTCPYQTPPDEVSGNNSAGIRIDGVNNRIDSVWIGIHPFSGAAMPNGSDGILVNSTNNTVVNCVISNNGAHGVMLVQPARFEYNDGSCNNSGFLGGSLIEPPVITSARADPTVTTLSGTFHGAPDATYRIDFLGIAPSCPYVFDLREAWINVTTDSTGLATWTTSQADYPLARIAAIASRDDIEVSRLSEPFPMFISGEHRADLSIRTTGPSSASTGQIIELVTVVTNNGPAAVANVYVAIPSPAGTSLISVLATPYYACGSAGFCHFFSLAAGQSTTIVERLQVVATNGLLNRVASVQHGDDIMTDPNFANNRSALSVPVIFDASNIPAASPLVLLLLAVALSLIGFVSTRAN